MAVLSTCFCTIRLLLHYYEPTGQFHIHINSSMFSCFAIYATTYKSNYFKKQHLRRSTVIHLLYMIVWRTSLTCRSPPPPVASRNLSLSALSSAICLYKISLSFVNFVICPVSEVTLVSRYLMWASFLSMTFNASIRAWSPAIVVLYSPSDIVAVFAWSCYRIMES